MTEQRYPNGSGEYRKARHELLNEEQALVDTVWPCWNLEDFTTESRPDILTPPQNFCDEFLEKHFLNKLK